MKTRILSAARLSFPLASALAAMLSSHQASALTKTWVGGTADWGTAGNWSVSGVPAAADLAVFTSAGTNKSIYLGTAARSINTITFDASTSATPYTINTKDTLAGITPRLLTVGAGGIVVQAGSHTIKGNGAGPGVAAELALTTASAFNVAAASTLTFEAKLGGASGNNLSKTGAGTLVIKNNNSGGTAWNFSGGLFTVSAGTLDLATSGATGLSSNKFSVTSGGTLKLSASGVWASTSGTLTLNGTSSTSGALYASATSTLSATTITLASTSSVGVDALQTLTIGSAISGVGGLTKVGDGNLTLSTANTYTGNTLVSAGKIVPGDALTLQNSAYDTASVNGGLDLTGFATPTLGGLTGSVDLSSTLITGYGSITNLTLNPQSGTQTYTGIIADGATGMILTKTGAGTQVLSGANTYTGATSITGGTLALGNLNALGTTPGSNGTSGISIAAGSALQSNTAGGSTIAAPITLVTGGDTSLRIGQGAASTTHTFTLNGAIGGATGNVVYSTTTGSFGNGTSLFVLGAPGTYTGNTLITTGNGGNNPVVVRAGTGVVDALPATTVLTFDNVTGGGTGRNFQYDMNGNAQTLAGLSNGGVAPQLRRQLFSNSGALATLTINNTDEYTFGGAYLNTANSATTRAQITGNIALTKSGSGTFTLGGALVNGATENGHPFTGDTKITGGILVLGESLSIQNSAFDTTNSIPGTAGDGLRAAVTTLTLGGLTGNNSFASRFTTTTGGYDGLTTLTLNPGAGVTHSYAADVGNGAGNLALAKTGAGTQILTGTSTYTGGTTLATGTLQFKDLVSMPATGTVAVGTGATLAVNVGGAGEWTAGTSGNGTIGGLLDGLGGQAGSTVTYSGNVALGIDTTNASPTTTYSGIIADAGTSLGLNKLGTNNLTLDQANTYSGPTTVTAGTLTLTNALALQNSPLVTTGAGTIALSGLTTLTLGGLSGATGDLASVISGYGSITALTLNVPTGVSLTYGGNIDEGATGMTVTKTGAGSQALSGTNSYTGITTVNEGTLRFGKQASLYNGTTGSWTAANINVKSAATFAVNVDSAGTAGFDNTNLDTLLTNISVANTTAEGLQSGANIGFATGTATGGTFTQGNVIADSTGASGGAIGVTKLDTGFLVLDKTNTYTGLTTINGGALRLTNNGALGATVAGTVVNGTNTGNAANARLDLSGSITVTGETATLIGIGDFYGALTSSSGVNEWAGDVILASPTFQTRLGASAGATLKVSGVIDDDGVNTQGLALRSEGSTGTVILSGANTYVGDTNLIIGKLQLDGGNNRLPAATKFAMGNSTNTVEFDLNGRSQEIAGLSILSGATAANNSANNSDLVNLSTLTVNTATASPSTFAGILKGNLALTKTGPETLTITGNNTYTGATTVSEGTLSIATGYLSTTTPINVASGAFLTTSRNNTFSGGSAAVPSGAWTIAGTITQTAAGSTMPASVTLNNGTISGAFKADFGPFLIAGSGTTITANGATNTINAGNLGLFAGLTLDTPLAPDALAISSQLGGTSALAGGLTKNGLGTVSLTGASTFSGNITVSNGTLVGAGATNGSGGVPVLGSRSNTRTITVNNGGTLQFNSGNVLGSNHTATTAPTLAINSGGVVTNGGIATNNALNNVQLNDGTLTSTTGHTSSTPPNLPVYGAWNLNGSVTSTGNSTITTTDPTKGWIMLKVVGDKTTDFNVTSGTLTVSAPVVDNLVDSNIGSLSKSGTGVMILSGANTYTGNTTVAAGTLVLADNAQLKFVLGASTVSNSLTGEGTVTLDGDFVIDTTAADALTSGTWTLENVTTLTGAYGSNFTVIGFSDIGGNKWEKAVDLTKKYTFDETTGILTLGPSVSYASWIGGFGLTGNDALPGSDPDFDGIDNGVEMVIGGNPATGMDTALLPTIELVNADPDGDTTTSNYLLFTYRRSDLSVTAGVMADCETDTDLVAPWTAATGAPGVVILTDDNYTSFTPPAANTDRVRVYVPRGANTTLFGRLNVSVP